MKRTRLQLPAVLVVLLATFYCQQESHAIGILAPTEQSLQPLRLTHQSVTLEVSDQAAKTKISQTFHNDLDRQLEAHYLFPVPKGAKVTDFILYINGNPQHAEVLESDQARKIYEDIVARMQDPGLLEYIDSDLFRVRIFPVPPRGDQKVELEYVQVLQLENGAAEYSFPMTAPGSGVIASPTEMDFDFRIDSKIPIKTVYSPTHEIKFDQKGEHHMSGSALLSPEVMDRDLTLIYTVSTEDVGLVVLPYRPNADKDGYFSILISPRVEIETEKIQPKAVTFVIDTSGSMTSDQKIEQAKKSLIYCLNSLREVDSFNVIQFATTVNQMNENLIPATRDNVRESIKWVERLQATGGTNIDGALAEALRTTPQKDLIHTIVFLTDGIPTIGNVAPEEILSNLDQLNEARLRIFTFGLGYDVNARLLDDIAEQTRSTSQYVRPNEDIELAVSTFFDKVASPVLTNLNLRIDGVRTYDLFPDQLPDLFLGSQLILFGRYENAGEATVRLEGELGGQDHTFVYETNFPQKSGRYEYIEPLWAHRKVGYLLDEIRKHGEQQELVDEVVELAKKYAIVTPYTSFLVTEDEPVAMEQQQIPVPQAMPRIERDGAALRSSRAKGMASPAAGAKPEAAMAPPIEGSSADALSFGAATGQSAVESSIKLQEFKAKDTLMDKAESSVRQASGRTFELKDGIWIDQSIEKRDKILEVKFASTAYFEILKIRPDLKEALALGDQLEIRLTKETVLKISPTGKEKLDESDRDVLKLKE